MNRKQRRAAAKSRQRAKVGTGELAASRLQRAMSHHEAGRLLEAKRIYSEILAEAPNDPNALHLLGGVEFQAGDARSGLKLIARAIEVKPNFPEAYNNFGNVLSKEGRLEEAVAAYAKAIEQKPDYADACSNLGVAFKNLDRLEQAEAAYRKAVELKPDDARAYSNLGVVLLERGKPAGAEAVYRKAVELKPDGARAYSNLGVALKDQGKLEEARVAFRRALELKPDYAAAYSNLGVALKDQGKPAEAEAAYRKAIELKPDYAEAYNNLGVALKDQGKPAEAEAAYRKAVELEPDYAVANYNLGNVLRDQGKPAEAEAACRRAVALKPDYAEAYNNLGVALMDQGKFEEARVAFGRALELKSDYAAAYSNLGVTLKDQGKPAEAEAACRRAVELNSDHAAAHNNLGNVLRGKGEPDQAVASFKRAVAIEPDLADAQAMLLHGLKYLCDWTEVDAIIARVDKLTRDALAKGAKTGETPFISVTRCQDPSRNLEVARSWSADIERRMSDLKEHLPSSFKRDAKARLRIGYLSGDLHSHATAHLMVGLFGLHDRNGFEINAYSYGPDDSSDYRKRIENDCDAFVDIRDCSTIEAARRIRDDGIDILVDLKGYTKGHRLEVCALRPAPVQVTYLGFPGSTGADFFDYILTDKIVTPPDQAPFYSEKFVYLPHCYQVNDHTQAISDKPFARADFGLPEQGSVFCSFNQSYKLDPGMWAVWMRILRSAPGSVLWLLRGNETAVRNLRREAVSRDVAAERIIFAEKLPKPEHLARLKLADLFLDTRIVNSHTTASDALWAGLPMVTLQGTHFASRVASSLLNAIGLPELVTHSLEDYEVSALELARDKAALGALREKLWRHRLVEPLFDTLRFVRSLEHGYRMMWELHAADEAPHQLEVPDLG